ncbi:hypothetical protein H4Q26_000988 [Puccinia striiformis f. sp. tritici PST-130]|nr:hypothetical protein H4Q26_000988 [Puccinia striiformis f. sp. tritici PST-130]
MRPPKQAVNGLIWLKILTDNDKVKNEDDEGFNNPKTFFKAPYCRPEDDPLMAAQNYECKWCGKDCS